MDQVTSLACPTITLAAKIKIARYSRGIDKMRLQADTKELHRFDPPISSLSLPSSSISSLAFQPAAMVIMATNHLFSLRNYAGGSARLSIRINRSGVWPIRSFSFGESTSVNAEWWHSYRPQPMTSCHKKSLTLCTRWKL